MNSASQDLSLHLGALRERMLHPNEYERAVHYFLEEFAGDVGFLNQSEPDEAPHVLGMLAQVMGKALKQKVSFDQAKAFHLMQHKFYHGSASLGERVVLFFYFQEADTGIAALIPGVSGPMEVARFRVTAALSDPRLN